MKKILAIASMAAMVAGAAFAEVTFGAWTRSGMDFVNLKNVDQTSTATGSKDQSYQSDPTVVATPDWARGSRVGVWFAGKNAEETAGFSLNVNSNGGKVVIGDQAKVWGKIGFVEVQFGKIQLDDLRGSIGDWGNRDIGSKGEDSIFTRFNPSKGMTIAIRPIDGLFFGAAIDSGTTFDDDDKFKSTNKLEDAFKKIQVGAGYTIANVAQLKAQFIGNTDALKDDGITVDYKRTGTIELGADLLFLANNTIEIGAKIPMSEDNNDGYFNVIAAISGSADKLSYKGHVYGDFAKGYEYKFFDMTTKADAEKATKFAENEMVPTFGLDAGAEYDLGVISLGGTAKYSGTFCSWTESSVDYDASVNTFGAELYAKKAFSNGYIFAGVADEFTSVSSSGSYSGNTTKATETRNTFKVPVGVEFSF